MRSHVWLLKLLNETWQQYFADVERPNDVTISFGRTAKRRLGSIRQVAPRDKNSRTIITITGYFRDKNVPEYIVASTIAHELCHYAHGFASPLPKFSRYPHHGGIVDTELKNRGLGDQLKAQKLWLKQEWPKIIGEANLVRRRIIRRKAFSFRKWLISLT
ncbi:MAG: hypothetical protein WC227_02815 [Patescibacteria group bacterium]|jgi:hypothetical protein